MALAAGMVGAINRTSDAEPDRPSTNAATGTFPCISPKYAGPETTGHVMMMIRQVDWLGHGDRGIIILQSWKD